MPASSEQILMECLERVVAMQFAVAADLRARFDWEYPMGHAERDVRLARFNAEERKRQIEPVGGS